jgi:hypothetical protein
MAVVSEDERLGRLLQVKLTALVEGRWGPAAASPGRVPGSLAGGATLLDRGSGQGWALDATGAPAFVAAALTWARRHSVMELHLVASDDGVGARVLARRAAVWADPPQVWLAAGRDLHPVEAGAPPAPIEPPAAARVWVAPLVAAGAEVVVEHGVIAGEVRGLEVARIILSPSTSGSLLAVADGQWQVAVGVGHHDREARDEMRPDEPLTASLDRVVGLVRRLRVGGAPRHPANTLARERWLRAVLVAHPGLVGAASLYSIPPPQPRLDLRLPAPAVAAGLDPHGLPLVVAASVGVDLDLVPTAAEARLLWDLARPLGTPQARLVLVVPEGDDYPVTRDLAAALAAPAEVVTVPRDWDTLPLP